MAAINKGTRRPRGSLDADAILDVAIRLAEAEGLEALSMRSLARQLAVPVTSVHWHFRTRDDLLDAIAGRMATHFYETVPTIPQDAPWDEALRTFFTALRQQLLHKASFLELSFDRVGALLKDPRMRLRMADRLEHEVAVLAGAGLPPAEAYQFYDVCSTYVRGFVLVELAYARARRPSGDEGQLFLDPQRFPVMSQTSDTGGISLHDADGQFQLGLELLISSIAARIAVSRAQPPGSDEA